MVHEIPTTLLASADVIVRGYLVMAVGDVGSRQHMLQAVWIALFWDESISVKLIGMCNRTIHVTVQECRTSPPFRVTFCNIPYFYGMLYSVKM